MAGPAQHTVIHAPLTDSTAMVAKQESASPERMQRASESCIHGCTCCGHTRWNPALLLQYKPDAVKTARHGSWPVGPDAVPADTAFVIPLPIHLQAALWSASRADEALTNDALASECRFVRIANLTRTRTRHRARRRTHLEVCNVYCRCKSRSNYASNFWGQRRPETMY